MASPFLGFENSLLTFEVPGNTLTVDTDGNAVVEPQQVTATATLKVINSNTATRPGEVTELAVLLEGYCITVTNVDGKKSMKLPLSVEADNWAQITYSGQPGYFYLLQPINPPYGRKGIGAVIEKSAGTKIMGWFQVSRN